MRMGSDNEDLLKDLVSDCLPTLNAHRQERKNKQNQNKSSVSLTFFRNFCFSYLLFCSRMNRLLALLLLLIPPREHSVPTRKFSTVLRSLEQEILMWQTRKATKKMEEQPKLILHSLFILKIPFLQSRFLFPSKLANFFLKTSLSFSISFLPFFFCFFYFCKYPHSFFRIYFCYFLHFCRNLKK